MSRLARMRALLLALALVPWIAAAADSSPVAVATELLDRLDQGEYEAATERFTTELKEAVSCGRSGRSCPGRWVHDRAAALQASLRTAA